MVHFKKTSWPEISSTCLHGWTERVHKRLKLNSILPSLLLQPLSIAFKMPFIVVSVKVL